jgi:hypothetical protein
MSRARSLFAVTLGLALLAMGVGSARAQEAAPPPAAPPAANETPAPPAAAEETPAINPVLAGLDQRVAMTVPHTTLGKLIEFLARDTEVNIIVDERYASTPVSLLGAEGTLGEVLSAVEAATGMTFRKIDDIYFLARSQEGLATTAHRERRERYQRMVTTENDLASAALQALQPVIDRLGVTNQARMQISALNPQQQALLYQQGYLTIGQLFPQAASPMFDVLRQAMGAGAGAEGTIADFAQRRVYFNPGLVFELAIPLEGRPQPYTWSLDLFGAIAP